MNRARLLLGWICILGCLVGVLPANGQHTKASLWLASQEVKPGSSFLAGVQLKMDPEWHTYWRNSGASGMPTTIEWQLPAGFSAGPILWPLPDKLPEEELTTYIYSDEVLLLVPISVDPSAKPGTVTLKASVAWLECKLQCLPGGADLEATLLVGTTDRPANAELFSHWQARIPQENATLRFSARYDSADLNAESRPLLLEWIPGGPVSDPDFFPNSFEDFEIDGRTEVVKAGPDQVILRKTLKRLKKEWPAAIAGLAVQTADGKRTGFEVKATLGGSAAAAASSASAGATSPALPLWQILLYAFIGGMILNIMPCVLPVIALKILGFVGQARDTPATVRKLGLIYALGVWVSFLLLAGMVIAVKAAGASAGWGMQFGNPYFLVGLTVVMTLVALNLFGVFEITPSAKVMDAAGTLSAKSGAAGAFFNGVLATVLATPCTAPFLGIALGFAFAASPLTILLVFTVVAAGLAFPYVLLSWNPAWLRFLPKPGLWMEQFKMLMGFPMLATAVWLVSLSSVFYSDRWFWLSVFLILLAMAAFVFGQFVQRRASGKTAGIIASLVLLGLGYVVCLEGQMDWRSPKADETVGVRTAKNGIPWEKWSAEAVAAARAQGRPVLVDFTADWCLTCQANKKIALEIPEVREKLRAINAVALLGDYTRLPKEITLELNRFNRAGVPLVLVYPRDQTRPPLVLPEALTPGIVLDALEQAAR